MKQVQRKFCLLSKFSSFICNQLFFFWKIESLFWKYSIAWGQKPRLVGRLSAPSYRKNDLKRKFFDIFITSVRYKSFTCIQLFFWKIESIYRNYFTARVQKPRLGGRFSAPSFRKNDFVKKSFVFFTTLDSFQNFPVSFAFYSFFSKIASINWRYFISRVQKTEVGGSIFCSII